MLLKGNGAKQTEPDKMPPIQHSHASDSSNNKRHGTAEVSLSSLKQREEGTLKYISNVIFIPLFDFFEKWSVK